MTKQTKAERLQVIAFVAEAAEQEGNTARLMQCVENYCALATKTQIRNAPRVIRDRAPAYLLAK